MLCMIRQATNYQTWEKETFKKVFEQFIKALLKLLCIYKTIGKWICLWCGMETKSCSLKICTYSTSSLKHLKSSD